MFINRLKTLFLISFLVSLFMWFGYTLNSTSGMLVAGGIAIAMSFFSYWFSASMVLKHYNAKVVTASSNPRLYNLVRRMTENANLPMPKVYIINSDQPNAFATGRNHNHAAVAFTTGILEILNDNELSGVIAHELGHVKHYDILISTIASVFVTAIMFLRNFAYFVPRNNDDRRSSSNSLLVLIIAPIAATILNFAVSRQREYMADRAGADYSGNPLYLRDALKKLEYYSRVTPMRKADNATAHMFIVNPLASIPKSLSNLFSTHPSTEERMKRLEKLAIERGLY